MWKSGGTVNRQSHLKAHLIINRLKSDESVKRILQLNTETIYVMKT